MKTSQNFGVYFFLSLLIALATTNATAASVTIDFEGVTPVSAAYVDGTGFYVGSTYTENGFLFSTSASSNYSFYTITDENNSYYTGSKALVNTTSLGTTSLTTVSGNNFDISSIDLAEWWDDGQTPITVNFTGTYSNNDTVSTVFTLDGGNHAAESFVFSSLFTNLVRLDWVQDAQYHQFDNFILAAVRLL